jgi:peptidoglycan/LPS O-acetylase OafA/YrhL
MSEQLIRRSGLLSRLSRVTSPGRQFVPQIDGLRFVAILAVIAYHSAGFYLLHRNLTAGHPQRSTFWLNTVFAAGHNGVALFFSISGFILSLPFAREALRDGPRVRLREYYWRRVTRIEPPYVIQLLAMLALCVLAYRKLPSHPELYHNPAWLSYAVSHIGSSFFYANGVIFGRHPYPNFVLWSLEVEVQFYIVAPFLARLLFFRDRTRRRLLLSFLIAGGVAVSFVFGNHYRVWASLLGNIHFFLLGFLFADLFVEEQLSSAPARYQWDLAAVGAGVLLVLGEAHINKVAVPVAIIIGFFAAFRGIIMSRCLQNPWISTIGGMCYTIYMYHVICISILIRATTKVHLANASLDLFVQFLLLTLAIIPACGVLFVVLERPFMNRNWPAKAWQALRGRK